MTYSICTLSGDGIGPEVIESAKRVIEAVGRKYGHEFIIKDAPIGGFAIDNFGDPLPEETIKAAKSSGAVLLGAVGGYKWDNAPKRPEAALLGIRKELKLYANLRPAKIYPALKNRSVLKNEIVENGIDFVTVRELTGGIYFGERGFRDNKTFGREAYDTECYSELEIERVSRIAYELAQKRNHHITLVDKANVLTSSKLWRKIVTDINEDYPDVIVDMMYVDNAAMQMVLNPSHFDVILTSNMFGDILSDLSAALVGSIGVMPSASLGDTTLGMYEAIHGSAPDIAGLNIADPVGTILSAAMMLRLSFDLSDEAADIEKAVEAAINEGYMTQDLGGIYSTSQVTDKIISLINP
ncbi:MAG: 3-isopropylmalate dehydrogenase [Clostridia bacterium]|nr:3-isopropylmalate dehydrogenase [Clostridia bacterium]